MSEHKNQTTWKVSKMLNGCVFIEDRDGNTVCEFYFQYGGEFLKHPNAEENARRIVECVNGYDALQARVKELEAQINSARLGFEFTISVYESKLSTVTAQRDELFKYAAHLIDCPSNSGPLKCDCGLAELITKIEAMREAL